VVLLVANASDFLFRMEIGRVSEVPLLWSHHEDRPFVAAVCKYSLCRVHLTNDLCRPESFSQKCFNGGVSADGATSWNARWITVFACSHAQIARGSVRRATKPARKCNQNISSAKLRRQ
jgi:hypothetical protein